MRLAALADRIARHPYVPVIRERAGQYARLMRLDRPVGIFLLLWPTLWALWIAGLGRPDPGVVVVFVLGDRELAEILDSEARWARGVQGSADPIPRMLDFVYTKALRDVRPASVSIGQ